MASQQFDIAPPDLPVIPTAYIPIDFAAPSARMTFLLLPLVEMAMSTSAGLPRPRIWRSKISSKP